MTFYNCRYQKSRLQQRELLAEVDFLETTLSSINLPQGLSHYDLHIKNMVYDEANGELVLNHDILYNGGRNARGSSEINGRVKSLYQNHQVEKGG